ncbi:H-NS histone family protein [Bradyrhizobium sp. Ai1a-2]|uniref:H-NS histone family protein n=1 Tax=Bradyrhizobium sp. Ai1a-2 TaxID=196490 RepID=UPI0004816BDB|nr:H-NS histone family protein [Bradyrhizobium sp. Ai1a-2]
MKSNGFRSMSTDALWRLHEKVAAELTQRMITEKATLEDRLRKLRSSDETAKPDRSRRPYPKVVPKYRNPKNPGETWSGRGKQPRWLAKRLGAGSKLDDFLINRPGRRRR